MNILWIDITRQQKVKKFKRASIFEDAKVNFLFVYFCLSSVDSLYVYVL